MNSSSKKIYGVDVVDHKKLFEQYFSKNAPHTFFVETMNRMLSLYEAFCTGKVTGKTVINFCPAPILLPLFPMMDFAEQITLVQINDEGVQEIEKWLTKHPDACDWSHAAGHLRIFKGISNESDDEEESTRRKIKVMKWDLRDDNPAEALSLPEADIVICTLFLEYISKDPDEYRRYLRSVSNVVKPEGFLFIKTNANCSYLKVGEETCQVLSCDESFYRKLLPQEGFAIKHCEKFDRVMISDDTDHDGGIFVIAQKAREQ